MLVLMVFMMDAYTLRREAATCGAHYLDVTAGKRPLGRAACGEVPRLESRPQGRNPKRKVVRYAASAVVTLSTQLLIANC